MSTERLSFNLNSLIPESYKSRAEAFAKCLQHKLLSLGKLDTSSNSFESESRKMLSDDSQQEGKESFSFCSEYSEQVPGSFGEQAEGKGEKTRVESNRRIEKTEDSEEEFCSHSESETSESPDWRKPKEMERRKQNLTSISSEDSTVDSWSSCQENLTDFEKFDSENEEVNHFASQIKGSPKLRNLNLRCKRKEIREKSWKKSSKKNHSLSTDSVGVESWRPKHNSSHPMESPVSESRPQYILLDGSEDDEVPHRILRESSSTSSLEKHFSRTGLEEIRNSSRSWRTQPKAMGGAPLSPDGIKNGGKGQERENEELINRLHYAVSTDFEGLEYDEVECITDFATKNLFRSVKKVGGIIVEYLSDDPRTGLQLTLDFTPENLTVTTVEVFEDGAVSSTDEAGNEDSRIAIEPQVGSETKSVADVKEDEEDSRSNLRRCSSLKTWKTPPGTPGAKKIVRFADALGLDLTDVRTFLDEIPKVPSSAYEDLHFELPANVDPTTPPTPIPTLVPQFQQPATRMDFLEKVQHQKVCLESALVTDKAVLAVSGFVRVQNMSFHKSVYVRYSLNNWQTFSDLQASYVPNSCDGFSDKFSFVLYGHTLKIGERLEFALRLDCCGSQYWDSNGGTNYVLNCLPQSSVSSFYSSPFDSQIDPWFEFY